MGENGLDAGTYLPAFLVRSIAAHPRRGVPWCDEVDGTMVMADLSGFTAMSERLAKLGDEGAERLTDAINGFFERMLGTAARYGGDTLTFGGDAILLLFQGDGHAQRAVAASFGMLKQVDRTAAVRAGSDRIKVGMSVGVHSERFRLAAVGSAEERVHLVVLGLGGETTALAESAADRGQVAVSAATRKLLGGAVKVSRKGDFWRVDEFSPGGAAVMGRGASVPSGEPGSQPSPSLVASPDLIAPFLPPYARSADGGTAERMQVTPEHRRTVIVFVNILGLDEIVERYGDGAALEQLQAYVATLARLAGKHSGFVVSSDIATRGAKLIVSFGAPVAHEYAPTNAARFVLELNHWLRGSGLDLTHKIGLNGGHVFAGEVGPAFRRQYTVMGDAVNLAARLMGAGEPGEPLASRHLLSYVSHDLCARELAPIRVKGKEKPVAICVLEEEERSSGQIRGDAGGSRRVGRLFGRRDELELLWRSWQCAQRGQGGAVLIGGEPGIGKTRLLEEALRGMRGGRRPLRAACFEHLQAAPFTPWVEILHQALKLPRGESGKRRGDRVRAFLDRRLPELAELGALLDPLLAVSLPPSDVTASLEGELRRQRLFELIARIVAAATGGQVAAVVVEDLHWMDESSLELTRYLAQGSERGRVLFLLTARPVDPPLDLGADVRHIVLEELTEGQSLAMVCAALGLDGLPDEVGDAIYSKTRGNPLFLEEVVHALHSSGAIDRILRASTVTRAAELAALEIPDRVQGLLMSRIDRLPARAREVLKVGSVVGRSFDQRTVAALDDEAVDPSFLSRAFDDLLTSGLAIPEEAREGGGMVFRHALVQEVAYESMPFARRRHLHARAGAYLEAAQSPPDHALLVHHYRQAAVSDKTRLHAVGASEASVAVHANHEAVDYLVVALETITERTPEAACLRSRLEELKGDSLVTLARHDEAIQCFRQARRRWASPSARRVASVALRDLAPLDDAGAREAVLCWKIAVSAERGRSAFRRSLRWLDKGAATLPAGSKAAKARILITRGLALSRLGEYEEAVQVGRAGVDLARRDGDLSLQAYALNILGTTLSTQGFLKESIRCTLDAIDLYEQAGDLYGLAMSHGNVGADCVVGGDLTSALQHHETSLTFHSRLGNVTGIAFQHMNIGGALFQMGKLEEAIGQLEEAIRLSEHPGVSRLGTGFSYLMLARSRLWSGELEQADQALAEAVRILESIDAQSFLLDAGIVRSELCLAQGDLGQAESVCRKVVDRARSMGAELSEAEASSMLGRILLAAGAPDRAATVLEASMRLAGEGGSEYERAKALALLAEAERCCGGDERACAVKLDEAICLFEQMHAGHDLDEARELRRKLETESAGARPVPT